MKTPRNHYPLEKICAICDSPFPVHNGAQFRNVTCSTVCGNKKASKTRRGIGHWNWKGGRKLSRGYVQIYMPEHPNSDAAGYVLEHRLVVEKRLGRYLLPEEIVHHVNEIKCDNRDENLGLKASHAEHIREHLPNLIASVKKANVGVRRSPATEFKKGQRPHNRTDILIACLHCGKQKHYAANVLAKGKGKFCSTRCSYDHRFPANRAA